MCAMYLVGLSMNGEKEPFLRNCNCTKYEINHI